MRVLALLGGWIAIILFVILASAAETLASPGLSKLLWWLAAGVAVVAAINVTSYR